MIDEIEDILGASVIVIYRGLVDTQLLAGRGAEKTLLSEIGNLLLQLLGMILRVRVHLSWHNTAKYIGVDTILFSFLKSFAELIARCSSEDPPQNVAEA